MEVEGETRVHAQELQALSQAVFETCGMSRDNAYLLADSLVDADLSGVHSHGVLRVPEYVLKLT
ncbi:MAG: Ldh family oxidoreductase, partial [Candidatus Latescibacteria bacterium]|nr:Ldh family oxidoreductase [Candidatus Latescibacterota bacterium]